MTTVAITGSASGIGAACATRLRADGIRVIGIDLHDADIIGDLATVEGRTHAIDAVDRHSDGTLDGLVTCAGLAGLPDRPGSLVVSLNHFGTTALLEGLRPLLARGTTPSAVAISSNSATIQPGAPGAVSRACLDDDEPLARRLADEAGSLSTYPASKIAVAHWIRRAATGPTWAGAGIRLNAVAPGLIDTPLAAEQRNDPVIGPMVAHFPIPMGRPGRAEEVAALIAFLLGPDAGFFCGSVVFMDGGSDALLRTLDWPAAWDLDLGP